MRYTGFLGGVGTSFPNGDLISPVRSIDECDLGSREEFGKKLVSIGSPEVAFDQLDVVKAKEFFRH